jgi:hypothetical protein
MTFLSCWRPAPPPSPVPLPPRPAAVADPNDGGVVLEGALAALMATGLRRWDALLFLAGELAGQDAAHTILDIPRAALQPFPLFLDAIEAFSGVAILDPRAANLALNAYLEDEWVSGDLDLRERPWVTCLPENLRVGGTLNLCGGPLESLPIGLVVRGDLVLRKTAIAVLPEDLRVGGSLQLQEALIEALPPGLVANGVKGSLWLGGTQIQVLPDGLRLWGALDLWGTPLVHLPRGLGVGLQPHPDNHGLDLRECVHWDGVIPADATVTGAVYTDRHRNGLPLAAWRAAHPHGEVRS